MTKSKGVFEKLEAEIVKDAGEYVKDRVKTKALHIGEISALVILGGFLIAFGVAELIGNYFAILSGGYNYVVLGFLFILASLAVKV